MPLPPKLVLSASFLWLFVACGAENPAAQDTWTAPDLCPLAGVRVLALGDSFVSGTRVTGADFGGTSGAFRTLLWNEFKANTPPLAFVGDRIDGPAGAYPLAARAHQGLPGWTVNDILNGGGPALTPPVTGSLSLWLASAQPNIVVLLPGADDLWLLNNERKSFAEYLAREKVVALIKQVQAEAPNAYILVGNHPPIGKPGDGNDNWAKLVRWYNDELENVRADLFYAGNQVRFIDVFSRLERSADVGPDGGHPNPHGYARIGRAFANEIQAILEVCNPEPPEEGEVL